MSPNLTGDRCRCTACGLHFLMTDDFDRHRFGKANARRCRTADELAARGWAAVDHWFLTRQPGRQAMTSEARTRMATVRTRRLPAADAPH